MHVISILINRLNVRVAFERTLARHTTRISQLIHFLPCKIHVDCGRVSSRSLTGKYCSSKDRRLAIYAWLTNIILGGLLVIVLPFTANLQLQNAANEYNAPTSNSIFLAGEIYYYHSTTLETTWEHPQTKNFKANAIN